MFECRACRRSHINFHALVYTSSAMATVQMARCAGISREFRATPLRHPAQSISGRVKRVRHACRPVPAKPGAVNHCACVLQGIPHVACGVRGISTPLSLAIPGVRARRGQRRARFHPACGGGAKLCGSGKPAAAPPPPPLLPPLPWQTPAGWLGCSRCTRLLHAS